MALREKKEMSDNSNEKIMKDVLAFIYSLFATAVLLIISWWVFPFVPGSPVISCVILTFLLLSKFGVVLRSAAELLIGYPLGEINSKSMLQIVPFGVGMLIAIAIPWLGGISGWGGFQWAAALLYDCFSFETFLSFALVVFDMTQKKD